VLAAGFIALTFWCIFVLGQPWNHAPSPEHDRVTEKAPAADPLNPWPSINPRKELEWHPCYQYVNPKFRCARLAVPLSQERQFPEVHIALLMLGPKNTTAALAVPKSPLLINPGGPGGQGVLLALRMGPAMQTIFGDDRPVIGFDPRGIGFTTPAADCFAIPPTCKDCPEDRFTGLLNRIEWTVANAALGGLNSSNIAMRYINARHRAVANLCTAKNSQLGGESILGHAATPHVATDMVSIIDAWERWVDREAEMAGIVSEPNPTKGKLVYWGFSYGTYLGATFASMYPDRVGRVILDGVADAEFYVTDMWMESLLDADKVLGQFFEYCAAAGPRCELYRNDDKPEDISKRYHTVLQELELYPPSFTHPIYFYPVILRPELMKGLAFGALYSPALQFAPLAALLNAVYEGEFERLSFLFEGLQGACGLQDDTAVILATDATAAVMCGDKTKPVDLSYDEIKEKYEQMAKLSQFADIWLDLMLQCNGWNISRPHPSPGYPPNKKTKTEFPVLFLSNTYDPVTPLHAAIKMALKFEGAGLVEQKSAGHCTVSAVSHCTIKKVRDYVNRGKVPPPPDVDGHDYDSGKWTVCEPDERPWQAFDVNAASFADAEEKNMAEALATVRDTVGSLPHWGIGAKNKMKFGGAGQRGLIL